MTTTSSDLARLIFPAAIFDYFEVTHIEDSVDDIHIFLDQINHPPQKQGYTYTSKGFCDQAVIQDFPIRGKAVYLHIRRRKWTEDQTGSVVCGTFDLTHLGTHLSKEFAAFLKGIYRK